MSEGRRRVPLDELLEQWDEALDENRRIMAPIIGRIGLAAELPPDPPEAA